MARRILIADDSVTIQKAFAMTVAAEDFTVVAARSADEAISLGRQQRPDLVIADGLMPGRSGYDLCAAIKSDAALKGVPVYILASSHQPYDEARGRHCGADGHLIKPWESGVLIDRLREAIAKGGAVVEVKPAPSVAPPRAPAAQRHPTPASSLFQSARPGEEAGRGAAPEAASAHPAAPPPQPGAGLRPSSAPPPAAPAAMRPSLIPGVRPGAMPPARPPSGPLRTLAGSPPAPAAPAPAPSPGLGRPAPGKTLLGVPVASIPIPGTRPAAPAAPAQPPLSAKPAAPAPAAPVPARPAPAPQPPVRAPQPHPSPIAHGPAPHAPAAPASGSLVEQKMAAIAARGPEYEALAKLSREVIEQIVWEIVPELAEAIIREELAKRGRI